MKNRHEYFLRNVVFGVLAVGLRSRVLKALRTKFRGKRKGQIKEKGAEIFLTLRKGN